MGRIDDALSRAGSPAGAAASSVAPSGEVFVSPWTLVQGLYAPSAAAHPTALAPFGEADTRVFRGFSPAWTHRLALASNGNSTLAEQFRRLAAALHQAQGNSNLRTVMVTSAASGDGKTLTALNLALILSESYRRRVLLIDADLRRPTIHDISQFPDACGLSEGLRAKAEQRLSVLQITERLTLLPAGRPDPDPMNALTSQRMHRVLEESAAAFDWVVLDAPPVGPVADAGLLAAMVDTALFVIRAGRTPCQAVQKAIDALGRDRIFGVVLNGVEDVDSGDYKHYSAARETPGVA